MKTKQAFKKIWIVALLVTTIGTLWAQQQTSKEKFSLPPLPYEMNALTPVISEATIKLHHGKHLKTYIDNHQELCFQLLRKNGVHSIISKKNSQQLPPRYSGLDGYGSQKIKKGNYTFCPKITPGTLSRKVTPQ